MNKISSPIEIRDELRVSTAALKAISQGVVITTADHLIISTNAAFADITQYPIDEILHQNCKFLQGAGSNPETIKQIYLALQSKTDFAGEILNYRKDGTPFWNELTISPIYDESGESITHFVGITRDITDKKTLQQERTAQMSELERMNKLMVDREIKMIELKQTIESLELQLRSGSATFS